MNYEEFLMDLYDYTEDQETGESTFDETTFHVEATRLA